MAGAKQWRLPCDHLDGRPAERSMHSEVSSRNLEYFIKEGRVHEGLTQSDLRELYEQADRRDGSLVVCNECDRIKTASKNETEINVVHDGRAAA